MEPLVSLQNIQKTYQTPAEETIAIKGFSLDIYKGDFIALVGPSGCGKSTVLSIIAGLDKPTGGKIIKKDNVTTGYMLQHDHLFNWKSIYKNAIIGLEIQKRNTAENSQYVIELLKKYGLYEFRNAYPKQLSGGMRQRAALIRTLAIKPDILLLDEPFSALDYQTRLNVSEDIANIISKENKTAVLVTHDLSEAISITDKVVVMSSRPSQIKNIYDIHFEKGSSVMQKRRHPNFAKYYDKIWRDIDKNES